MGDEDRESARFLTDTALSYMYPAALRAAAEWGVADFLIDGPETVDQLAVRVDVDPDVLRRVMRLLVGLRIVAHRSDTDEYILGERGRALASTSPHSVRREILAVTTPAIWRCAGYLADAGSGEAHPVDRLLGSSLFAYFADHPDEGAEFHAGMAQYSAAESVVFAYEAPLPFNGVVCDVGGGRGGLLTEILPRRPSLRGILFDQPSVVADVDEDTPFAVVGGDFFESVPAADVYMLQYILHNWDDERCVRILRNCRDAMTGDGAVLVHDYVLPESPSVDDIAHPGYLMDLVMLVITPGRERTASEFERIFADSGFRTDRIISSGDSRLSIIRAVPV